ncbi:hypothetical protein M1446_02935 [Candidatus Dependentiae bacterium]|nr:hypothetical protein [Candidatus Dependentiae bacterium]
MKKLLLNFIFILAIPFSAFGENIYKINDVNIWKYKNEFGNKVALRTKFNYTAVTASVFVSGYILYKLLSPVETISPSQAFSDWFNNLTPTQHSQYINHLNQHAFNQPLPAAVPAFSIFSLDSWKRFVTNKGPSFVKSMAYNVSMQLCMTPILKIAFPKLEKYTSKVSNYINDWDFEWFIENQTVYQKVLQELHQELGMLDSKIFEKNMSAQLLALHKMQTDAVNSQTNAQEYYDIVLNKYALLVRELEKIIAFMEYRKYIYIKDNNNDEQDIFSCTSSINNTIQKLKNTVSNFAENLNQVQISDANYHSTILSTIKKIELIVNDLHSLDQQIENS